MSDISQRLSIATRAASIGIWDWDVVNNVLIWDDLMYALYGVRREQFSGAYEAWQAVIHPDDLASSSSAVERALRGEETLDTEFRVVWPDGSVRHIKADAEVFRDEAGEPLRMIGANRDITDIREAQAALARKNEALEFAIQIDRIGARVMVALNARDLAQRPGAEVLRVLAEERGYQPLALYLYNREEGTLTLDASLDTRAMFHHQDYRLGDGWIGEVARTRISAFVEDPDDGLFRFGVGSSRNAERTMFALPLVHQSALLGVIAGVAHGDLVDRERSWLELIAAQVAVGLYAARQFHDLEQLSKKLETRAKTIALQNEALERASRMKSEFLTTMSHELRTPLNAVIGFTNVLLKNKEGNLTEKNTRFLTRILANGRHLLSLLNDILDLSKIEAGRMEIADEAVSLGPLTDAVLSQFGAQVAGQQVVIVGNVPPGLEAVRGDTRRLKQVLINLMGNALKFTETGSVELRVLTRDRVPTRIDVIDSGIGIPRDKLEVVMEAFRQADGGISRKYGGTGLGLTISRVLCEAMGFELKVNSVEGRGTIFSVVLSGDAPPVFYTPPALTGNLACSVSLERSSERTLSGAEQRPTILVIDDEPDTCTLVRQLLSALEYRVVAADSGLRGIEIAQEIRPALVILDLLMPGLNGFVTLKMFQDDPVLEDIPVVVCSVVAGEHRFQLAHAVEVLEKPLDQDTLEGLLERVLGGAENKKLLVIDDEPDARTLVTSIARGLGFEVESASDGEEGFEKLQESPPPDLIVLDLMMPVMDGFRFLSTLRAHPEHCDIPVVICSAAELDAEQRARLQKESQHVFTKDRRTQQALRVLLEQLLEPVSAPLCS